MKFNQILPIKFNGKLFLWLYITFIFMVFIGTMTYCLGGFIAGKCLGYNLQIHYAYIDSPNGCNVMNPLCDTIQSIKQKYPDEIKNNLDFPEKMQYKIASKEYDKRIQDSIYIHSVASLTPILIGTIGFILLIIYRRRFKDKASLSFWQWALIFKSLFWLRSSFFLVGGLIFIVFSKRDYMMLKYSYVNRLLGWKPYLFPFLAGCIGLIVLAIVVFKFIPKQQRLTFLIAGLLGGVSGSYLWMDLIGKYILP